MDFKSTNCYKNIKNSGDKITPVPYYVTTNIIVTETNFSTLVDLEEIKYQKKIDSLTEEQKKTLDIGDLREKIEERIKPFMDSNLLELKYAYFTSSNVDIGFIEVERVENFNSWLIE